VNYYSILQVAPSATSAEIKAAYHRVLLLWHPDKRSPGCKEDAIVDIDLLKEAYRTLVDSDLRKTHDARIRLQHPGPTSSSFGPRPAQVISLDEFTETDGGISTHSCRCGGCYSISEDDMERGQHLVACESCSEVVWVGYEIAEDS
ncbi:DnaJ-domain-containing protein, partial [Rickenella mellea]